MRSYLQRLADAAGHCAAAFLKIQLYFLGRERARLEGRYGRVSGAVVAAGVDTSSGARIVALPKSSPRSRRLSSTSRRGSGHVA